MPIPSRNKDEDRKDFVSRCMSDPKMASEFPDPTRRSAVCLSKAVEDLGYIESVDFQIMQNSESTHDAGSMEKYVFKSKDEAMKMAQKIGMDSVHDHKTGDGATVWMPGKNMEEFQSWYKKHSKAEFKYRDPKTGEIYQYERRGIYKKNGRFLILVR
jgi:hypothetical protein